jgi:hypothetical protein
MRSIFLLLFTCLLFTSQAVLADPYLVEVVVFQHLGEDSSDGEIWPEDVPVIDTSEAVLPEPVSVPSLPLESSVQMLKVNPTYRVLHRMHWIQEPEQKSQAPSVRVLPGALSSGPYGNPAGSLDYQLDGLVKFYQGVFLQAEVNVLFSPSHQIETGNNPYYYNPQEVAVPRTFVIDERRRIKLEEVHYFDHPKFGLLLSVVKAPKLPGDAG